MLQKLNTYDYFIIVTGSLIVLGFLSLLAALVFIPIPEVNKMTFDVALGALGTMTASIVNYLIGSSRGSKEKDNIIQTKSDTIALQLKNQNSGSVE